MIKIKNKVYKPKPAMRMISALMLIAAAGMVEGALSFKGLLLPALMTIIFGYFALSGDLHE